MKTIKRRVFFAIESQSDEPSAIAIDQPSTRRWIFPYILPLFNVYRYVNNCTSQEMQIYAAQPIIFSATESFIAISSDRVLLFTFLRTPNGSKIVL